MIAVLISPEITEVNVQEGIQGTVQTGKETGNRPGGSHEFSGHPGRGGSQ